MAIDPIIPDGATPSPADPSPIAGAWSVASPSDPSAVAADGNAPTGAAPSPIAPVGSVSASAPAPVAPNGSASPGTVSTAFSAAIDFHVQVVSSGDGANTEYDGNYQFLGISTYGDVWAKVSDAISIDESGAIIGSGRIFVRAYFEIDQWRLSASADWEVDEPNGYLVQSSPESALTPAEVTEWLHATDSDIEGTTVTRVRHSIDGVTAASSPISPSVPAAVISAGNNPTASNPSPIIP